MANSLSTHTLRQVYFKTTLAVALRNALVSEKISRVDRSVLKTIENPFITQQTATIQSVAGTYSVSAMTTTDDTLTVADEVIFGTHVFRFEELISNFELITAFFDDLTYSVAFKVDQFVLNTLLDEATGSLTTPAGGFTTPANIAKIMGDLIGKVAGFQTGLATGLFLVLENTDITGFVQTQVASGFSYADSALNNGFLTSYMGVDIFVIRANTFVTATLGTLTATNDGHRLFGVRSVSTYATPRGVQMEEKGVSGKTGKEIVVSMIVGAKLWTPKSDLFIDITLG